MRVVLGSDHAGFELKEKVKTYLQEEGFEVDDVGTHSTESVDYPDFARMAATKVRNGEAERGILMCGTGIGVCIAANKLRGIRAAVVTDNNMARLSREHNDANVMCLPGRFMDSTVAREIVRIWLQTPFQGGRHQDRIEKIAKLEEGK